jgi:glycolate oxidase FAD binding subunit
MSANQAAAVTEAIDRVRAAMADRTSLRIQGAGSKTFYLAHSEGASLSTAGLNGVLSYEPSELVITVGAGTPLAEVEALLAEQNQCLPFEPPHFAWSGAASTGTIGGMVASGLSGPGRANAGGVRDYVLGLRLINGRGEHLTFGGQVMKNVAGYDVSRLMVGAMGSLGVMTEVSLKVLPIAHAQATVTFQLSQYDALEQLHRWGGEPLPLNASTWCDGVLTVRLRGAVAAVEAACTPSHQVLAFSGSGSPPQRCNCSSASYCDN